MTENKAINILLAAASVGIDGMSLNQLAEELVEVCGEGWSASDLAVAAGEIIAARVSKRERWIPVLDPEMLARSATGDLALLQRGALSEISGELGSLLSAQFEVVAAWGRDTFYLANMIEVLGRDPDLVDWLAKAKVGESRGGVTRIS